MNNKYIFDVINTINESDYDTIMVYKNKLTDHDIYFLYDVAHEKRKKIIFASMQTILFNQNNNILVVEG